MNKEVKKEYEKHSLDFEKWDIGILAQFLHDLEQQKWSINGEKYDVRTPNEIVEEISSKYSTHTPDSLDFFYKHGMYQKARRAYEKKEK